MKSIASLLLILFVVFIATPTFVTYVDKDADVSMAYTANEEENSAKNQIAFEYTLQDHNARSISLHFLKEQAAFGHYYQDGHGSVFLDVISPPPKLA